MLDESRLRAADTEKRRLRFHNASVTLLCSVCDSHICEPTLQFRKQEADHAETNHNITSENEPFLKHGRQ
jgi:hypothetical protein